MRRTSRVEQIMGFPVSFDIRDPIPGAAVDWAVEWLREVDLRFSPFRPDSEVSRFGRGEVRLDELSEDLLDVLEVGARYEARTGGAFRVWPPGRAFDPSAVVKGWAVQRAAEILEMAGARNFCLNAGGDVVVRGGPEPGKAWRIGVRHPDLADTVCAVFEVMDGAVATSATYERGAHIVDGRTGLPASELISVTVIAADLTVADTTATAAFAMGTAGITWAAAEPGCEVLAVDAERVVYRSPGLGMR
ncbi:MAG TPA: FAD:protein FMN transferase [Actinophytocola sp.]|uniref:FAD:protein FMN transferase n=1 Tax=Actinophytocola sp. TaxID=1872138 RepID=UPI002DFB1310|nr:FAD:protein FMN transferase [Actinophytocola sp.]